MSEHTIQIDVHQKQCPNRSEGLQHCWHATGQSARTSNGALFMSMCCWCAPSWMHLTALQPHSMDNEALSAEQMRHGSAVSLVKMPPPGPRLLAPNNGLVG